MQIKLSLLVAALMLLSLPALAQQSNSEVSVNFTGNFQTQTSGFGLTDSASSAGGFLVNYRYHFNRWSAVEVNYGHTRFSQFYSSGNVTQANVNEATFAYQFTFGISGQARFHPFVEAGTGALFFSAPIPEDQACPVSRRIAPRSCTARESLINWSTISRSKPATAAWFTKRPTSRS